MDQIAWQVFRQQWQETMGIEEMAELVRERLRGKRYLIVFDNVWSEKLWCIVRGLVPDDNVGSRVIVTTCSVSVARSFTDGPSRPHP